MMVYHNHLNMLALQVMDRKRPPPAREPSPERSGQTLSPPPRKRNRPDSLSLSPAPMGKADGAVTSKTLAKPVETETKRASRIGEEITERRRQDERRSDRELERPQLDSERPGRSRDERRSDRREYERERYSDRRDRHYDDRRDRHSDDRRDRYKEDRRERERRDRDRIDDRYHNRNGVAREGRRETHRHYKRSPSPARPSRDTGPSSR